MTPPRSRWKDLFGVDLRSLALFRIGLAVCVLADLAARSSDLVGLYTDAGALPGQVLFELYGRAAYLSLHYWAGAHPLLQAGLFAATAAVAVALALGRFTWFANLACWYLVSSLQVRNPLVYIGGDSILRLLLFWGLFLPLGARLSLDASRPGARPRPDFHASGASAALLLQVALIYWVTGLQKSGELWWSGQAVAYALRATEWATPLGVALRDWPLLLEGLSWLTLGIELFGPFLAFVPVRGGAQRLAAVALFWSFHLALAACMQIGLFPLFSMVAWLPFLPQQIWRGRFAAGSAASAAPDPTPLGVSIAALLVAAYVGAFMAGQLGAPLSIPGPLRAIGRLLRLEQSWAMFAPDPPRVSVGFELIASAPSGEELSRSALVDLRWLMYLWRAVESGPRIEPPRRMLTPFLRYHCGRWNQPAGSEPRAERIALRRTLRGLDPGSARREEREVLGLQCRARRPG